MKIPFKAVAVDMDGTFLNDQRSYDHQLFDLFAKQNPFYCVTPPICNQCTGII